MGKHGSKGLLIAVVIGALAVAPTAVAALTSDASDRTNLVHPAFECPGGYPQSGRGYLGHPSTSASVVLSGSEIEYPGGYPQSGRGYLGHPPAH